VIDRASPGIAGAPSGAADLPARLLERVPPHSIEAEMAVLGSLLVDGEMLGNVAPLLKPPDFYRGAHQRLYEVMLRLYDRSEPVDALVVFRECERQNLLEETGGRDYIATLASAVTSPAHAEHYAEIVREKSVARSLIAAAVEIQQAAYAEQGRGEDLIDLAETRIHAVSDDRGTGEAQPVAGLLHEAFDEMQSGTTVQGVRTGYLAFDDMTTGLKPGELVIVAGRPSMGKTTFALNAAMNAAITDKKKVLIFSLEMSAQNLVRNMLCALARFPGQRLRRSAGQFLSQDDLRRLADHAGALYDAPILIDDTGSLTPSLLRAKSRRVKSRQGLDLIVVDYLQLMDAMGATRNVDSRQQEISYISRSLKSLARDLDVPVIAISQLNRDAEKREGHKPRLSDLRESGALEQDADLICMLYRPYYYTRNESDRVTAEVIIAKQRNGPTGTVNLHFFEECMRFDNPTIER
jgi:replicative DNA helicase